MFGSRQTSDAVIANAMNGGHGHSLVRRKTPRMSVHIRALLHCGSKFQSTIVHQLSTDGAGLSGAMGVAPGQAVTLQFLDGRAITGKVKWWIAGKCGIAFDRELLPEDPIFSMGRKG